MGNKNTVFSEETTILKRLSI